MDNEIIVAIIGAVAAIIASFVGAFFGARKGTKSVIKQNQMGDTNIGRDNKGAIVSTQYNN